MSVIYFIKTLWFKLFPIGKKKAVKISMKSRAPDISQFHAFETLPENMNLYHAPQEPCWYVSAPWGDGLDSQTLRSSRIIIVSKKTGRVLYDGSAHDEG